MKPQLPNTSPTIRVVNGKEVCFYSPVQLEAIVPPEQRLAKSRDVNGLSLHQNHSPMRSNHIGSEWNG